MLQLKDITKSYHTAGFTQVALDNVSIAFPDNEFVAILGPSGSGKTTLLNVIGGLDHYDSGSMVIDGIDTSHYTDRDWDAYRNNRIGFVFQSYNLIPHQTVLANVELALTLTGVDRAERRQRAIAALEEVDLGDHIRKLPNQLSGGQMQRVAIARALINDPEILLADEPTGALDSSTSLTIMALLTRIAQDRLVIMVTHNPELAEQYATRTVDLRDGRVAADSAPFDPEALADAKVGRPPKRTSMSFWTAIALSFRNLMTKKGRTLMTAFAGSIGIIGIATILALASGVQNYIKGIEEDTLSVYPLSIQNQGLDMTALMTASAGSGEDGSRDSEDGYVSEMQVLSNFFSSVGANDLAALKTFLDEDGGDIDEYTNLIQYGYNITPQIFSQPSGRSIRQVNPDSTVAAMGFGASGMESFMPGMKMSAFSELIDDHSLIEQQYEVVAGHWPESYDEAILVLTPKGRVSDFVLYTMGLKDPADLDKMITQFMNDEPVTVAEGGEISVSYDDILSTTFKVVNAADYYTYDATYDIWTDRSSESKFLKALVEEGWDLGISGIVAPRADATATALSPGIYYTSDLTRHLIDEAATTPVVQAQLASPTVNIFTGRTFAEEALDADRDDLDLLQMVSVDEDAIQAAFQFDESQLSLDPSALNLSLGGFQGLQIDPGSLPVLDISGVMDSDGLADSLDLDIESILENLDVEEFAPSIPTEELGEATSQMMTAYLAYCATVDDYCFTDPEASFEDFLATDEGSALTEEMEELVSSTQEELEAAQQAVLENVTEAIAKAVQQQVEQNAAVVQSSLQQAVAGYMEQAMTTIAYQIQTQVAAQLEQQLSAAITTAMDSLASNMSSAMSIDQEAFLDAFSFDMDEEELGTLILAMMDESRSSFDANLAKLNYADYARPSSIDIYPKDFEGKGQIITILDDYNAEMADSDQEDKVIVYTDIVGALMSSVTEIVNIVSWVLVAFVAVSLVVSSIMIGVITYISVLERKKEIGILRSIGASKGDIRTVFNAETLIVGFVAGVLGIAVTLVIVLIANAIVYAKFGIPNVAILPWQAAIALVGISMLLTFVAGLIPSSAASRRDPVEALRSE